MQKDSSGFYYPLRVWLITVVGGPFILLMTLFVYDSGSISDFLAGIPLFAIVSAGGVLLAIPSLLLFCFCYEQIKNKPTSNNKKKMFLSVVGTASIFLTLLIADSDFLLDSSADVWIWPGSYAVTLVAAIFLVKMNNAN